MSFKIIIAVCLAFAVVSNAQLPDFQKCIETMRGNILNYSSSLQGIFTNFTQDISGESGVDTEGVMEDINALTAQYMQLANSLSSLDPQTFINQGSLLMAQQGKIIQGIISSIRLNPSNIFKGFELVRNIAELNMKYMNLFNPISCLQQVNTPFN